MKLFTSFSSFLDTVKCIAFVMGSMILLIDVDDKYFLFEL